MPYMNLKDADIYYDLQGQGMTMVFIHGAGGNHGVWWQQIPYFSKWFQVAAMDMRGFGLSKEKEGSPGGAAFTGDLEALLDHLKSKEAILVGQSLGGWPVTALTVKSQQRIKALVLSGSTGGIDEPALRKRMVEVVAGVEGLPMKIRALSENFRQSSPVLADLYRQFNSYNSPDAPIKRGRTLGPTPEQLKGLKVPVIFIGGEEDQGLPPDALRLAHKCVPGAELHILPGVGHSGYFEQPSVFNHLVHAFLKKALGAKAPF
jgi:pimeloyl-ACP methyl ester carboxylesterase